MKRTLLSIAYLGFVGVLVGQLPTMKVGSHTVGPTGPTGATGPTGTTGPTGPTGAQISSPFSGTFVINPTASLGGLSVTSANDNIGVSINASGTGGRNYAIYSTAGASGYGQGLLEIADVTASFAGRVSLNSIGLVKFAVAIGGNSSQPAVNATSCTGATIGTGATNLGGTITGLPTGACSVILTMANSAASATGWACHVNDQTTANLFRQTASSTTTVTFAGTSVSGDVLVYGPCAGY